MSRSTFGRAAGARTSAATASAIRMPTGYVSEGRSPRPRRSPPRRRLRRLAREQRILLRAPAEEDAGARTQQRRAGEAGREPEQRRDPVAPRGSGRVVDLGVSEEDAHVRRPDEAEGGGEPEHSE